MSRCAAPPARAVGNAVTFEPGARTAWHTHPVGQTLYVLAGTGRVQTEGGPVQEIHPGDVVWIPPGEKHWHGAVPGCRGTHLAVNVNVTTTWLEAVSAAEYQGDSV